MPLYLRIANELYLKRLIVGGFEGVYEFAKDLGFGLKVDSTVGKGSSFIIYIPVLRAS